MKSPVPAGSGQGRASPGRAEPAPAGDPSGGRAVWRRRLSHGVVVVFGWLLFAWSWQRVTADRPEIGELFWLLVAALMVVPVLTLSWVAHNVGIYRRKGPRRAVTPVSPHVERDFNGRRISADWPQLQQSRRIEIVVDDEHKRFVDVTPAQRTRPARAAEQEPA